MGNLADRLILGHVTDFIDVVPWFIFNLVDVAILAGFVGFVWDLPDVAARFIGWFRRRPTGGSR